MARQRCRRNAAAFPEINTTIARLRNVLGDPAYESLVRAGEKRLSGSATNSLVALEVQTLTSWRIFERL